MLLACGAVCVVLHCTNATVDAVDDVAADAVAVGDPIADRLHGWAGGCCDLQVLKPYQLKTLH